MKRKVFAWLVVWAFVLTVARSICAKDSRAASDQRVQPSTAAVQGKTQRPRVAPKTSGKGIRVKASSKKTQGKAKKMSLSYTCAVYWDSNLGIYFCREGNCSVCGEHVAADGTNYGNIPCYCN